MEILNLDFVCVHNVFSYHFIVKYFRCVCATIIYAPKTPCYSSQIIADPSLTLKQRALVADAARSLDKAKMMRFDEKSGNFYCTELGRVASHFYIQYSSVETYNEMLKRHMNESEVCYNNSCFITFSFDDCIHIVAILASCFTSLDGAHLVTCLVPR